MKLFSTSHPNKEHISSHTCSARLFLLKLFLLRPSFPKVISSPSQFSGAISSPSQFFLTQNVSSPSQFYWSYFFSVLVLPKLFRLLPSSPGANSSPSQFSGAISFLSQFSQIYILSVLAFLELFALRPKSPGDSFFSSPYEFSSPELFLLRHSSPELYLLSASSPELFPLRPSFPEAISSPSQFSRSYFFSVLVLLELFLLHPSSSIFTPSQLSSP